MSNQQTQKTKRRTFLKTATAAAVGTLGMRPESVFGAPANSAPRIGIIGCGGRGRYVGRYFYEVTDARIVSLMDPFADRLEQTKEMFKAHNPRTFQTVTGHEDLIDSGVDGVVLTSPPYFHPAQAAAVVDAGKHVYMAKPVAVDVTGCLSILESSRKAAQKKLNYLVDFQTRVTPYFIEAAKRVRDGAIGRLVCGQIFYQTGRLNPKNVPGETKDQSRLRNWVFDIARY